MYNQINFEFLTLHHEGGGQIPPNKVQRDTALHKTFMEVDGIGQLGRFHCIINYGTQIVSWKKSQSAVNIWNFP